MRNTIGGVAHGAPAFVEGVFCMCNGSAILISSLVVLRVGCLPTLKVCTLFRVGQNRVYIYRI